MPPKSFSRNRGMSRNSGIIDSGKGVSGYKNEYIPNFISKKPFYIDEEKEDRGDYLEHQRLQNKRDDDLLSQGDKWYERGKRAGPAATKYRKGACENCGAMTHKKKDCLERPRKLGAKWTGKDIAQDEVIQSVELGWDGKRDRWNGYDTTEHQQVIEEYNRLEELRQEKKTLTDKGEGLDGDEEDEDEDKYAEESEMPGQSYDSSQRISTRNLRIREDTAKYLLNLDLDSAKYDPKTRTMVDAGALSDEAAKLVAEEGFMRSSGDAADFERAQRMAWETRERGDTAKMHLQANPTEGEIIRRKLEAEKEVKTMSTRQSLLQKYGGAEYLKTLPKENAVIESERYVEYSSTGELIKGKADAVPKSKYKEDFYVNNHTSVWGSWWSNFRWGYSCCHSHVRNSYCTGSEGIQGAEDAEKMRTGGQLEELEKKQIEWRKERQEREEEEKGNTRDDDPEKDEEENTRGRNDKYESHEDKKRKREQLLGGVTEEDMEEYRRKRLNFDDPMANFVDAIGS